MRRTHLLPFFLLLVFSYSFATKIKVEQFVCSGNVINRTPVKISKIFSTEIDKVYCFTKVKTDEIPTYIYHVWYKNGKKIAEIKLNIKYKLYRTWSYKTIFSNDVGDWKVELLDSNKNKIAETYFKMLANSGHKDENEDIKAQDVFSEEVDNKSKELNKNSVSISNNKKLEDSLNKDKEINSREEFIEDSFSYQTSGNKLQDFISKSFYLVLLIIFYLVFFPTVYFFNRKLHLKW